VATKKITVEIELTEKMAELFDALVEARCLDREKYLKKLLANGIASVVKKTN
jgi:hypothetical protein